MTRIQKGSKFNLRNLLGKTREENDLRMKVLRYVMAVGFVLSPWLGGEAYAAGIERIDNITLPNGLDKTYLQNGSNVAHIYAEKASGDVGLNRFKTFEVGANQIANLYFKTSATDTNHLNTLVNTVQEQISISGTVNAIRNNEVGGKLYFLSPKGMVVGSTGVINAGSLTAISTRIDDITNPGEAITAITAASTNNTSRVLINEPIVIHGQINTVNGIDLRSLSIAISKDSDIKPYLKTGVVFEKIVNTNELNELVGEVKLKSERSDSTDTKIKLCAYKTYWDDYWEVTTPQFGNITLSECDLDAIGGIEIVGGQRVDVDNTTVIKSQDLIKFDLEHGDVGVLAIDNCTIETEGLIDMRVGNTITIGVDADIISRITKDETTSKVTLMTSVGNITNNGTISTKTSLDIVAGVNGSASQPISDPASITNNGTIHATGGGMSFTADRLLINKGTIQSDDQIIFRVGGSLTNEGKIESTSSNVQAHIGRNFKNVGDANSESSQKGLIQAGGNVQVDYELNTKTTGIGVATPEEGEVSTIDGIYNSGFIKANGDEDPTSTGGVVDVGSGSGNIWLTSSYNIENTATGQMIAGRQITLNARDFLDNYGLIQGVTYLDIKSIMGYVYNHGTDNNGNAMDTPGRIISTGGNIALSSGQANLQIDKDEDGKKKEEYRKFTPIIIEGKVEATSDDDESNQTRKGNIEITAFLGDIYINGGTIETKPELGTNDEVKAVAGDVILDAAQNITIGFKTEKAWADDPTTDNKYGDHPEYDSKTERGYYKPVSDSNSVPSSPCDEPATISGSNIALTSGSNKNNYILISNTKTGSNTLTASNAITINTNSMNIIGGTFNAGTLAASKNLNIAGGTINTNNIIAGITDGVNNGGQLTITGGAITTSNVTAGGQLSVMSGVSSTGSLSLNGVKAVTIGGSAGISSSGNLSVTSNGSVMISGNAGASDEAIVQAGGDVSVTSTAGNVQNSKVITAGKNVSMTATQGSVENSRAITAGTSAVDIGNIELTAGNGISLTNAYELTADGTVELNTANMNITTGTINADTLAASGALTISGVGTINAANVTAGGAMSIAGGTIKTGTSQGSFTATSINMSSGSITGKDVIISADEQVQLQGGSLVANAATLEVKKNTSGDSIVESANGFTLDVDSLSVSANKGAIKLNGSGNVLQSVTLANAGGDITIVNGNDTNHNALNVSTAGTDKVQGAIIITNNGADITVGGVNARDAVNLTAGENITVTGAVNASGATLQAAKGIDVTGSINTTGEASLTAGKNITVAGDVAATNASFGAGVDFIHDSGAIAAGEVVVTAGQNVQLNGGSMVASKSASLTAGTGENLAAGQGFIAEQAGYAIDAPQVTVNAVGSVNLNSTANQLVNVNATQVGGALTIGSGNTKSDAALQIATADTIQGNLTVINYASDGDAKANEIVFGNNLDAIGNIVLNNQETDINIGQGLTISSQKESVSITSAGNVNMAGTISAKNVNITASEAISQTAGSIVAKNTVATAGSNLSLASTANKLQNVTVKADKGSVAIVSGNDAEGALKVKTDGTVGGTLSITNVDDGVDNAIVIDNDLLANGDITIDNKETDINLGANVSITSQAGGVKLTALNNLMSTGTINAADDVVLQATNEKLSITGGSIITTGGSIDLSSTGDITNNASITSGRSIVMISEKGGILNDGALAAKGSFVFLSASKDITNKKSIAAHYGVAILSLGGKILNEASITAGVDFGNTTSAVSLFSARAMDATSCSVEISGNGDVVNTSNATISAKDSVVVTSEEGTVNNSSTITANTGSVEINGNRGVTNTAMLNAGTDVSMSSTTGNVQNSGTIKADQSVGMTADAGTVKNSSAVTSTSGAVVISGQTGVTNTGALTATGGSVEISGSNVSNSGAVNANGGSVTMSGSGGVTNDADISAKDSVTMTSEQGTVDNSNTVSAGTGTVTMSGKTGVVNDNAGATISAGSGVSMTSSAEGVTNSSAVKSTSGTVEMDGQKTVTNTGAVTATGGFVTMSGSGGVTNDADISAKDSVTMTSSAGAVDNSNAITVSNGSVTMTGQTSVNNEGELKANGGSVTMSGNGGVTNSANITAGSDVSMTTDKGKISNSGTIEASNKIGMTSTSGDISSTNKVESLNGSISATTTYGEVNISEIIAGGNATASSQSGSVSIGTVAGNDVVLTGGSNVTIGTVSGNNVAISGGSNSDVDVDNITVDNSLKLQGDNIAVDSVGRGSDAGTDALNVDVNGAGGAGSAVQGSLNLKITGDVVFDNLNVTDANVTASGNIDVNKLRVEGEGETTLVSNKTEGDENGTKVTVVGKDATPPAGSNVIVDPGNDSGNWLNIKMDEEGSKTTVVDDAGRDVNNKDYPAQMSAKLVDYDPYDTYLEHYADMADIFSRSYLIDTPERSSSDILFPVQGGRVVLKQDVNGLHLEISEEEQEA